MSEENTITIESINQALADFLPHCRVPVEWNAHSMLDPEYYGAEPPQSSGIGILVKGDQFRLFDPVEGTWTSAETEMLVFTIREGNLLSLVLPGSDSMTERPLLCFEDVEEIPGSLALHIQGALDLEEEPESCDPIDEIFLPLAQYPDDEASTYQAYPYVPIRFLTDLLAEHCTVGCPWLAPLDREECENMEAFAKERSWDPASNEENREEAEQVLAGLEKVRGLQAVIRKSARETADRLCDEDFLRDLDSSECMELRVSLFEAAWEEEYLYPFLVRFNRPVFLPFCSEDLCPNLHHYLFHRVMLAADLPEDVWPLTVSKDELAKKFEKTTLWPSFGQQVAFFFELRTLQLTLQASTVDVLRGNVAQPLRPASQRIKAMRKLVSQIRTIVETEENVKLVLEEKK